MVEKNIVEPEETQSLDEVIGSFSDPICHVDRQKRAREMFDRFPIRDIREACLKQIWAESDEEVAWLIERFQAYKKINDYSTALMILRVLANRHNGRFQGKIVELMAMIVKECLENKFFYGNLKESVVILCGKINRRPELYNATILDIFLDILRDYDAKDKRAYNNSKDLFLVVRVFSSIFKLGDTTFLPLLEENAVQPDELQNLAEYVNVSKEEFILEGTRLLLIKYLKYLKE